MTSTPSVATATCSSLTGPSTTTVHGTTPPTPVATPSPVSPSTMTATGAPVTLSLPCPPSLTASTSTGLSPAPAARTWNSSCATPSLKDANMGTYREAVNAYLNGTDPTPDITKHTHFSAVKYGFGWNNEQEITGD